MSLFCNKTFGISVNIINFLLDPTKKVSFDAVLCEKVETPVKWSNSRGCYPILAGIRNVRCMKKETFVTLET